MITDTNLKVDNRTVKFMTINGRIVYSTSSNYSYTNWALENQTLQYVGYLDTEQMYNCPDGTTYGFWWYETQPSPVAAVGGGSNSLFPIAQHVWCRAKHYNSTITSFTGPKGTSSQTFTVKQQIPLTTWAQQQGLPIPTDADLSDIEMVVSNEATTSDNIPYLADWIRFQGYFYKDRLAGSCAYVLPKTSYYEDGKVRPQPVVFTDDIDGKLRWSTPNRINTDMPGLIPEGSQYDYIRSCKPSYLGTTGDSGRPIVITISSYNILVSHNWEIYKPELNPSAPYYMTGPNYFKAYDLLKAFAESKGDTINTLNI